MKKIIIVLLTIFFLTGCYDYVELNDLSIIEGIGIDKINNEYKISLEELINKKSSKNEVENASTIVTGTGSSIASAIANASEKVSKNAYFAHLKIVLINQNLNEKDLKEIIDYFLRSTEIRKEFYLLTVKDFTCEEILNFDNEKIASDEISSLLANNSKKETTAIPYSFEQIIENLINKNQDPVLNIISQNENNLIINGIALYDKYKYKTTLNQEESKIYNILIENANNIKFTISKNNLTTISIYKSKRKEKIKNNSLYLTINLEASIDEYSNNKSLKIGKSYLNYDKEYQKIISNKIKDLYKKTLDQNMDILGIENLYYSKYKKKINWQTIKLNVKTNIKINKKGLIFNL